MNPGRTLTTRIPSKPTQAQLRAPREQATNSASESPFMRGFADRLVESAVLPVRPCVACECNLCGDCAIAVAAVSEEPQLAIPTFCG